MMFGLIPLAASLVGPRFAKPFVIGAIVLLAIGAAVLTWNLWLSGHDRAMIEKDRLESNLRVERQNSAAKDVAADERLADERAVTKAEKEMIDEVRKAPDSAPDAARVRLGCERLRRAGTSPDRLPAVCRSGS